MLLTLTGDLSTLAETVVLLLLFVFISTNVAVLVLRRDTVEHDHFRVWTIVPVLGVASCVLLLTQQSAKVWLFAAILLAVGAMLYLGARRVGGSEPSSPAPKQRRLTSACLTISAADNPSRVKASDDESMTEEAQSSLTVIRETSASVESVWNVLADGWTYSQWVVGNSRMRAVDRDWPAPGSQIHHSIGLWPLVINDITTVEACTPREELVLLAKTRPFGAARITLRLSAIPTGCRIEMAEVPASVPLKWLPDSVGLAAAWPRNRECTWRLAALAERRPDAAE